MVMGGMAIAAVMVMAWGVVTGVRRMLPGWPAAGVAVMAGRGMPVSGMGDIAVTGMAVTAGIAVAVMVVTGMAVMGGVAVMVAGDGVLCGLLG